MSCPEMLSDTNIIIFPPTLPAKKHVPSKQECAHLRARTKQYVIKVSPPPPPPSPTPQKDSVTSRHIVTG